MKSYEQSWAVRCGTSVFFLRVWLVAQVPAVASPSEDEDLERTS